MDLPWVVMMVRFPVVVVAGISMVGMLAGCTSWDAPLKDRNRDPRALPGTDPQITLQRALTDHGLVLPPGASAIRYKSRNDVGPYWLDLRFMVPCSQVNVFSKKSHLRLRKTRNGLIGTELVDLDAAAKKFGDSRVEAGPYRLYLDDQRAAAVIDLGDGQCRVIAIAQKDP